MSQQFNYTASEILNIGSAIDFVLDNTMPSSEPMLTHSVKEPRRPYLKAFSIETNKKISYMQVGTFHGS